MAQFLRSTPKQIEEHVRERMERNPMSGEIFCGTLPESSRRRFEMFFGEFYWEHFDEYADLSELKLEAEIHAISRMLKEDVEVAQRETNATKQFLKILSQMTP